MPSPFPGMDPWLESRSCFPDFHSRFLANLSAAINVALPPPFFAALATRVYAQISERNVEPDIDVLVPADGFSNGGGTATLTEIETELLVTGYRELPYEEFTEPFLEIRTTDDNNRLITSVEMLSLINKTRGSAGRGLYENKQQELLLTGANLVEIDFLRGGVHATLSHLRRLRHLAPRYVYHISITRWEEEVFPRAAAIELNQRLPRIPIPLTPEVPAIAVDLQPVFERTYEESLFSRRIDYRQPPDPLLTPEQQAWAEGVLNEKGLRTRT